MTKLRKHLIYQVHLYSLQALQAQIIFNLIIIQISYITMKWWHQRMDISTTRSCPFKCVPLIISNLREYGPQCYFSIKLNNNLLASSLTLSSCHFEYDIFFAKLASPKWLRRGPVFCINVPADRVLPYETELI